MTQADQFLTAAVRAATAESVKSQERNDSGPVGYHYSFERTAVANDKDPNVKQPGKNPDGDHFNPGNMAGKGPEDTEQTAKNRGKPSHKDEETPGWS